MPSGVHDDAGSPGIYSCRLSHLNVPQPIRFVTEPTHHDGFMKFLSIIHNFEHSLKSFSRDDRCGKQQKAMAKQTAQAPVVEMNWSAKNGS